MKNPPVPYPWTIRGHGDNISLVDLPLVNPFLITNRAGSCAQIGMNVVSRK